jgi:hypothetical protein
VPAGISAGDSSGIACWSLAISCGVKEKNTTSLVASSSE